MRSFILTLLSTVSLVGCQAIQQGPPLELADVAVPTVVREAVQQREQQLREEFARERAQHAPTATIPPPSLAPVSRDSFRMWVPRVVTGNGDVYEGHYVDVSEKAPQKELRKPDYEIPMAPKIVSRPAAKTPESGTRGTSTGALTRPLAPSPPSQGHGLPLPPLSQDGTYEPHQP
jgi:hypothetical protein